MKRSYEELPYGRFAYVDQTGKKLIVVCVFTPRFTRYYSNTELEAW